MSKPSVWRSLGLAAILLMATASTSRSGYLATDLGAGNTYNTSSGYNLAGSNSGSPGLSLAVEFSFSGSNTFAFGSAQLALEFHSGTNSLSVQLLADNGGTPGTVIETIAVNNIAAGPSLVTVASNTNPVLLPMTNYWLAATALDTTSMTWMQNSQNSQNHLAYRAVSGSGPGAWNLAGGNPDLAYSISAVPAPGSVYLLGSGMFALAGLSGLRRFGRVR